MARHTDGPWVVFRHDAGGYDVWTAWKDEGVRYKTGVKAGQFRLPPARTAVTSGLLNGAISRIEDARLIAAAPQLLEASRLVLKRLDALAADDGSVNPLDYIGRTEIEFLRSAITKANGGTDAE